MALLAIVFVSASRGGSPACSHRRRHRHGALLLYLPRYFGMEPLTMHVVGGLTISQALFASLFGGIAHWRSGSVNRRSPP